MTSSKLSELKELAEIVKNNGNILINVNCSDYIALIECLQSALNLIGSEDYNTPRELCAQMSEGEGNDVGVYKAMARSAMIKMDNVRKKIESKLGGLNG